MSNTRLHFRVVFWSDAGLHFFGVSHLNSSKLNERVGWGNFIGKLNKSISYRLPDSCSVFQAEVTAILLAVRWLLNSKIFPETILIYSDSQAAIKSLASVATTSKLVLECRASLEEMARQAGGVQRKPGDLHGWLETEWKSRMRNLHGQAEQINIT